MSRTDLACLTLLWLGVGSVQAEPPRPPIEVPKATDPRLIVELFAAAPDIVQPIAVDFDANGRLLVVESHTHFRPASYDGPNFDRIRILEDTNGDGKADRFTTFFEGTTATMDLAVHPDGSVYVATRNEIVRLRDTTGDGKADEKTRIVFLETKGNYPHNGLSGLAFDSRGNLDFGMGENLGEPYKLIAADGTTLTGGGEGGNYYTCTADGKKLHRVATGFWNPFGAGRDLFGRLFIVDNDPDASPPCRLLHVVPGGDYGFQFRYGRAGRHPFQAWNGELAGTLPMMAGTGESPCEVVCYESDGLPAEYLGNLLVPAWADHRVERYVPRQNGASLVGDRQPFVQGGKNFYPSGLAVAPDGSLYVSDWGSQSYQLHGKGAIWRIRWKDARPAPRPADPKQALFSLHRPIREAAARTLAKTEPGREFLREHLLAEEVPVRAAVLTALIDADDRKVDLLAIVNDPEVELGRRELALRGLLARGDDVSKIAQANIASSLRDLAITGLKGDAAVPLLMQFLINPDPFLRHAAVQQLAQLPESLSRIIHTSLTEPKARIGLLLAWRASGERDTVPMRVLADYLEDPDPDVRFLAMKWVSDEKLTPFRGAIAKLLEQPLLDPRAVVGAATTLARLDNKPISDDNLAGYFLERLRNKQSTPATRLMAIRAIPSTQAKLKTDELIDLLKQADPALRVEALRVLKDRADAKAKPAVIALARDDKQPVAVRAQSLVTLAALPLPYDTDLLIQLSGGEDAELRLEALRALVEAKLSPEQRQLRAAIKTKIVAEDQASARINKVPIHTDRPAAKDTEGWLKLLEGPADAEAGRRIFEQTQLAGCFKCHQVEGRGANVGPDLSLIGRTDRQWILESLLRPSAVVAPHYQTWQVQTLDERTRSGLLVHTNLDESQYIDEKGNRFKVLATDVQELKAVKNSIMPEGLLDRLTDQEIRDLIAYLLTLK